jgi:hypothetical protein
MKYIGASNLKCKSCGETKTLDSFNKSSRSCRDCQHVAGKKHYQKRKQHYIDKATMRKDVLVEFLRKLKDNKPCVDCKIVHRHFALDFDHRDPSTKTACVSAMVGYSREKLLEEIDKCDLVCATCHRYRTFKDLSS